MIWDKYKLGWATEIGRAEDRPDREEVLSPRISHAFVSFAISDLCGITDVALRYLTVVASIWRLSSCVNHVSLFGFEVLLLIHLFACCNLLPDITMLFEMISWTSPRCDLFIWTLTYFRGRNGDYTPKVSGACSTQIVTCFVCKRAKRGVHDSDDKRPLPNMHKYAADRTSSILKGRA